MDRLDSVQLSTQLLAVTTVPTDRAYPTVQTTFIISIFAWWDTSCMWTFEPTGMSATFSDTRDCIPTTNSSFCQNISSRLDQLCLRGYITRELACCVCHKLLLVKRQTFIPKQLAKLSVNEKVENALSELVRGLCTVKPSPSSVLSHWTSFKGCTKRMAESWTIGSTENSTLKRGG